MDAACPLSCSLADFKLCRFRTTGTGAHLAARSLLRRAALFRRPLGRNRLWRIFRGGLQHASLRWWHFRRERISTFPCASFADRAKVGCQRNCLLAAYNIAARWNSINLKRNHGLSCIEESSVFAFPIGVFWPSYSTSGIGPKRTLSSRTV